MESLEFDSGVRAYRVNGGGVLHFHPGDPNLYARLQAAGEKLHQMQREAAGEDIPTVLREMDEKLKMLLCEVFPGNDIPALFGGVNLLAPTQSGKTVFENFMAALEPILAEGAAQCAKSILGGRDV